MFNSMQKEAARTDQAPSEGICTPYNVQCYDSQVHVAGVHFLQGLHTTLQNLATSLQYLDPH